VNALRVVLSFGGIGGIAKIGNKSRVPPRSQPDSEAG